MAKKFPMMLAHKFSGVKIGSYPVAVEPKIDGIRALVIIKVVNDELEIATFSRAGNQFTSVNRVQNDILDIYVETGWEHDLVLDGELFCGDFAKTSSQIRKKKEQSTDAVFYAFDILPLKEWEEGSDKEYSERRQLLHEFFKAKAPKVETVKMTKAVLAYSLKDVHSLYADCQEHGHEGAMVKQLNGDISKWKPTRSWGWMKLKSEETLDLKIIGAQEGEGRCEGMLGNLVVDYAGHSVDVGTGFTEEDRISLWKLWQEGSLKGKIVEVAYQERTAAGSLRHPVYRHLRIDK